MKAKERGHPGAVHALRSERSAYAARRERDRVDHLSMVAGRLPAPIPPTGPAVEGTAALSDAAGRTWPCGDP